MVFNHGFRMAAFRLDAVAILSSCVLARRADAPRWGTCRSCTSTPNNIEHHFGHHEVSGGCTCFGGAASCVIYGLWAADPSVPLIRTRRAPSAPFWGCIGSCFPSTASSSSWSCFRSTSGRLAARRTLGVVVLRGRRASLAQARGRPVGGVAYGAHLGGFAAGRGAARSCSPSSARDAVA